MGKSDLTSEDIRKEAWNEAVHTYGTAYIFEQRANKYRLLLRIIGFLGIIVPLIIGAIYLSFREQQQFLDISVMIAGILGVIQVILSAWSLSARWEDNYSYALESQGANYGLSGRFENLGKYPPSKASDLQLKFELLKTENGLRTEQDNKQGFTDKERRKGMRWALRKFQRACAGCNQVPLSMKPTNCDICGNF